MSRKLKFIHITKTGGSSISECAKIHGIYWGIYDCDFNKHLLKNSSFNLLDSWHIPISYCKNINFLKLNFSNYDLFTVVRNPYERCLSEYYCKWGNIRKKSYTSQDLNNFVKDILHKFQKNKIYNIVHSTPQYKYVFYNGEKIVKHVLFYENIVKQIKNLFIKYKLNIELDKSLFKSKKNMTVLDFNYESIKLIQEVYEKDLISFNYSHQIEKTNVINYFL